MRSTHAATSMTDNTIAELMAAHRHLYADEDDLIAVHDALEPIAEL